MDKIPAHVFECVCDLFKEDTKDKLLNHLHKEPELAPADWFETYINILLEKHFSSDLFDAMEIRNSFYRKRQSNKKNWVKALEKDVEKKNPNPITQEIEVYQQLLSTQKHNQDKIKELLPVQNLHDLYDYRLRELKEWAKNKESLLTDYFYFKSKLEYQIERAFETDFVFLIADYFGKKGFNGQWVKSLKPRPIDLINIPWSNGTQVIDSKEKQDGNSVVLYSDYDAGNNLLIRTMFAVKPSERVLFKKTYALDEKDSEIIQYVLENRGTRFYSDDKSVTVDLKKLGRMIYQGDGGKTVDLVKQRMRKIATYSQEYIVVDSKSDTVNMTYIVNVFQEVVFDEKMDLVTITFSDRIHQNIINKQTVQVYSDITEKLENSTAKTLIYALQKERIDCYVQGISYSRFLDYFFFSQRVRFRSKRIEQNLKVIEKALLEFKELSVLIEKFERKGTGFTIDFIPLSDNEKQDYFEQPPLKTIDGS